MRPTILLGGLALLVVAVATSMTAGTVRAQKDENCQQIRDSLLYGDPKMQSQQVQGVAPDYLFAGRDTMRCLVDVLNEMRRSIHGIPLDDQTRGTLLRITGVVRSILSTQGAQAIQTFRRFDGVETASVLAFAARDDDPNLRINATLVLADVIDDATACVAIDHLYDPALLKSAGGESARINLVGVVSVVAPWGYRETYANIERLAEKLSADIRGQENVSQAAEVLANLKARLRFQKAPNRFAPLPGDMRDCAAYEPMWANTQRQNLIY